MIDMFTEHWINHPPATLEATPTLLKFLRQEQPISQVFFFFFQSKTAPERYNLIVCSVLFAGAVRVANRPCSQSHGQFIVCLR